MNLGITILYKKPTKEPPNPFSFISPFSYGVSFKAFYYVYKKHDFCFFSLFRKSLEYAHISRLNRSSRRYEMFPSLEIYSFKRQNVLFFFQVWTYIAGTYVGASCIFFILGRFAAEEWQNPYPCIEEPETLDNQWSLANSFWYTLGSMLTQGSELAPM